MLAYLRLLRPRQVLKNGFCFAGVLFSGRFEDLGDLLRAVDVFLCFTAVSSAVYVFNDLHDLDRDRLHPRKKFRPLASGEVSIAAGIVLGLLLIAGGLLGASFLGTGVWTCLTFYICNNIAYTLWFKHQAIYDVLSISLGFVLRLLAGVYVLPGELPTTWITLCTFFLTLFLGFAKRRAELADMPQAQQRQRPVMAEYSIQYLDFLVNSAAAMTILCYALFTTSERKNPSLVITVPIVYFAVMHYQRKVLLTGSGEEPERIVVRDGRLLLAIGLWFLIYFYVVYSKIELFR